MAAAAQTLSKSWLPAGSEYISRSEGFPSRDICSLGVMAQGLAKWGEFLGNRRRRRRRRRHFFLGGLRPPDTPPLEANALNSTKDPA